MLKGAILLVWGTGSKKQLLQVDPKKTQVGVVCMESGTYILTSVAVAHFLKSWGKPEVLVFAEPSGAQERGTTFWSHSNMC